MRSMQTIGLFMSAQHVIFGAVAYFSGQQIALFRWGVLWAVLAYSITQ